LVSRAEQFTQARFQTRNAAKEIAGIFAHISRKLLIVIRGLRIRTFRNDIDCDCKTSAPRIGHAALGHAYAIVAGLIDLIVEHNAAGAAILFAGREDHNAAGRAVAADFDAHVLIRLRSQYEERLVANSAQITTSCRSGCTASERDSRGRLGGDDETREKNHCY